MFTNSRVIRPNRRLTIEAFWWMYNHNAPRDVMMKTVDPYGMMNNDPNWVNGQKGHSVSGGQYVENLGGFVKVQTSEPDQ